MRDPASITLSNGAVVRVGDVVPMTDGTRWYLFERRGACLMLHKPGTGPGLTSFYMNGNPCLGSGLPAIDLAALAQPASAQAGVAELVATFRQWQRFAEMVGELPSDADAYVSAADAYRNCANALAALGVKDG